jgi:hypothetical protein
MVITTTVVSTVMENPRKQTNAGVYSDVLKNEALKH